MNRWMLSWMLVEYRVKPLSDPREGEDCRSCRCGAGCAWGLSGILSSHIFWVSIWTFSCLTFIIWAFTFYWYFVIARINYQLRRWKVHILKLIRHPHIVVSWERQWRDIQDLQNNSLRCSERDIEWIPWSPLEHKKRGDESWLLELLQGSAVWNHWDAPSTISYYGVTHFGDGVVCCEYYWH